MTARQGVQLVDRWFLRRLAPENVSQIAEIRSVLESYESVLFAPMLQKLASATSKYRES